MYILLTLLILGSFAAAVAAAFTGYWGIAGQQIVICLLAANAVRAELCIDRLVVRNLMLWQDAQHTNRDATSQGDTP